MNHEMQSSVMQNEMRQPELAMPAAMLKMTGVETLEAIGRHSVRYSLALVLLWIGGMKFTAYEAQGISGFVSNSPLMSWAYAVFSVETFSSLLGVTEVLVALLIAARPLSARAALIGSAMAAGTFLTTLSFLLSTPGVWEASIGGFPALSAIPGQFLIKDVVLFSVSVWLFAQDWGAAMGRRMDAQDGCPRV